MSQSDSPGSSSVAPQTPPPVIPGHVLLRRFAAGHYGEVWLARNSLGGLRAVKILYRQSFADTRPYEREFLGVTRFEPVSREHPGLVDILHVGRDDEAGCFYYTMELADDASGSADPSAYQPRSLRNEVKRLGRLPPARVLEVAASLAAALDFLHQHGLVHRDIKPGNIIFVGGEPKFADAGLVADLGDARTFVGTEGFIPPEGPGTVQADIYSFGKVIYEALTGNDRQDFPELPPALLVGPDHAAVLELNEVVLKACAVERDSRYKSAAEMLAELRTLQDGKSLLAAHIQRQRFRHWILPGAIAAVLVLFLGLLAAFVSSHPRTLFEDSFSAAELNTNLWFLGNGRASAGAATDSGWQRHEFAAGELLLETRSEQTGPSHTDFLWLELRPDLRNLGPLEVVVDAVGSAHGGEVVLGIAEGVPDAALPTAFVPICSARNDFTSSREWPSSRISIHLLPACRVALVYLDPLRPEIFKVVPLDQLKSWHFRAWVKSETSKGFPAGAAQARISRVVVRELRTDVERIGCVIDSITRAPVDRALVKTANGAILGRTDQDGTFLITKAILNRGPVTFHHDDYLPSTAVDLHQTLGGGFLQVPIVRTNFLFGAVLEAFPLPFTNVVSFCGAPNGFAVIADCSRKKDCFDLFSLQPALPAEHPGMTHYDLGHVTSASRVGDTWLAFTAEPLATTSRSGLYRLSQNPPVPLSPVADPQGVSMDFIQDCTFDGENLWFLEVDDRNRRYHLAVYNLAQHGVAQCYDMQDRFARGLAWDGQRFWIASGDRVYCVDREELMRQGTVEPAIGREFPGSYWRLNWNQGALWGLDRERNQLCRIKTTD